MKKFQPMLRRFRFLYASFLTGIGFLSVSCVSIDTVDTLGGPEPALREKSAADTQLHLISWNVHKGMHRAFTRDVEKLLDAIPEGNDVTLCLQEVRSNTFGELRTCTVNPSAATTLLVGAFLSPRDPPAC